jgi:hypothetical protein
MVINVQLVFLDASGVAGRALFARLRCATARLTEPRRSRKSPDTGSQPSVTIPRGARQSVQRLAPIAHRLDRGSRQVDRDRSMSGPMLTLSIRRLSGHLPKRLAARIRATGRVARPTKCMNIGLTLRVSACRHPGRIHETIIAARGIGNRDRRNGRIVVIGRRDGSSHSHLRHQRTDRLDPRAEAWRGRPAASAEWRTGARHL